MEKQVFLDLVRGHLLERGVSEAMAERQLARISSYIDTEGGDHVEAMLDEEDPRLLAEEICAMLRRNAARRAAQQAPQPQPRPQPAQPTQSPQPIQPRPIRPAAPIVPQPRPTAPRPTVMTAPQPEESARTREMDIVHPSQTFDLVDLPAPTAEQPAADYMDGPVDLAVSEPDEVYMPPFAEDEPPRKRRRSGGLEVDPLRSRAAEYADEKGGPLFWVAFILALPFLAALALGVLALFVSAFALLAGLIVVSIAALAVVAAVGTAFTLVSIVYSIVQMLSVLPIGLYELGIGITAGAIVLFVSILLYNFAIRLLPFAIKQLARFFGWTVRSLRALFIYVKGACAKL